MSTAVETLCDGCGRPLGATAILVGGQRFHALCVPARVPLTPEEACILAGLRDGTLVAVPRERTEAMHQAAQSTTGAIITRKHSAEIWTAMLAAAPEAPGRG